MAAHAMPCCCLVPSEAAGLIIGRSGSTVKHICEVSGAQVNVSGDRDTPRALTDRIVTIQGDPEQIEKACREVIRIVHRSQELDDSEHGVFVTVVPAGAVEHIIGPGGDTIEKLVESTSSEINISRHAIAGTELQPVSIAGTPKNMLIACMRVLGLVQELADQGGLTIDSSTWPPRRSPSVGQLRSVSRTVSRSSTPMRGRSVDGDAEEIPPELLPELPTSDTGISSVLFVVSASAAAWIVGRSGRTVSEIRTKSGAAVEVARNGGPLRLVELRGEADQRKSAVELLLETVEELPAGAPRETQLLAPPGCGVEEGHLSTIRADTGAQIKIEQLGAEGADGFGTGSGCRLILVSGPKLAARQAAMLIAALLGRAATRGSINARQKAGAAACPNCGNVFTADAAFCQKCGQKREEGPVSRGRGRDVSPAAPRQRALSLGAKHPSLGSDGETQLLKALLSGPSPSSCQLKLLLPADFVRLCLEAGSHLAQVSYRTGSHLEVLAPHSPEPTRLVLVQGTMLGNSMAVMHLQELLLQFQGP
ncbi:KHSRP [Symbiodinium microadriaticum]|nr:KHSRP [Symbiodinium sp. KB8]CAE7899734.1 KHSRP [Symbiodinium microadriaticum]